MKLLRLMFLSSAALLAACAVKTTHNALTVALSFAPNPPVRGLDTLTVSVTDASGNRVTGARVRIKTTMPAMSMSGPNLNATANGAGSYTVRGNLQYSTSYVFDVTAAANGAAGTAHVTQDVK